MSKRLDEIEARANAATPGPWCYDESDRGGVGAPSSAVIFPAQGGAWFERKEDEAFVLSSREDVLWLVARVRKLEAAARGALEAHAEELGSRAYFEAEWSILEEDE